MRTSWVFAVMVAVFGWQAYSIPSLEGTWITPCDTDQQSQQVLTFHGNALSTQVRQAADASCATVRQIITAEGTFSIGLQSSVVAEAFDSEFTVSRILLTVLDSEEIPSINHASACGYNDWAVGVAKDVTGKDCGGGALMPKAGEQRYDILRFLGSDHYLTGKQTTQFDGLSAANRPRELDTQKVYTRTGR